MEYQALRTLRNSPYEVHQYEAADRLSGHTNTVAFKHNGHSTQVDTGFIVLNAATYSNFIPFLKGLNVKIIPSKMTSGVSRDHGAFEWTGTSLSALFTLRENLFRLSFWRMILFGSISLLWIFFQQKRKVLLDSRKNRV